MQDTSKRKRIITPFMNDTSNSLLEDIVRQDRHGAITFGEFIDAWNFYFSEFGGLDHELEKLTKSFLLNTADASPDDVAGPQIRRMLSAFPNPACLVRRGGTIVSSNVQALDQLGLDAGDSIDALPFGLKDGQAISEAISRSSRQTNARSNAPGSVRFIRVFSDPPDRSVTLAVLNAQNTGSEQATSLVFVIEARFCAEIAQTVQLAYGLTPAEADILKAFMSGAPPEQISKQRGTSSTTVRTQLQSVMTKSGVSTQAELMCNALALTRFNTDLQAVADVAAHPYRKRSSMLRPGGRNVEVILCGDLSGDLVVVLPEMTLSTFPASIEAEFARAGLCVVTFCRPGIGGSDPVPHDVHDQTIAEDLKAFLRHYERDQCVIVSSATSTPYAYRLGGMVPELIRKIVILRGLPPGRHLFEDVEVKSSLPNALRNGFGRAPHLMDFFGRAALKSWRFIGIRNFTTFVLRENKHDVQIALQPDVIKEFEAAYNGMVAQGYDLAMYDLGNVFRDWSDWIHDCEVPVEWFLGGRDTLGRFKDFDAFASNFDIEHRLTLLENAGYMAYFTHVEEFVKSITSAE